MPNAVSPLPKQSLTRVGTVLASFLYSQNRANRFPVARYWLFARPDQIFPPPKHALFIAKHARMAYIDQEFRKIYRAHFATSGSAAIG